MHSRRFPRKFANIWSRCLIPCVSSGLLVAATARPQLVRAQDEAIVDRIASLLVVEDARRFDLGVLSDGARAADPTVRRRAALAIGRIAAPEGLPLLLELLADPDSTVQGDAVFALGLLRDTAAVQPLRQQLGAAGAGPTPAVALEAVTALAKIGGPAGAAVLDELLRQSTVAVLGAADPPGSAVRAALEAWRLGPDAPVATLIQLAGAGNVLVRRAALYSLARLRAPAAGSVMLTGTDDVDPLARNYAVRALTASFADSAGLGREAVARVVSRLAADENPGVRIQALRALATFADSSQAGAAADRMADSDMNVRVEALATLGRLGGPDARRVLAEAADLEHPDFAIGRQGLLGLARVDRTVGIRRVAAWITSLDWRHRLVGSEALGILGGDTALTWLEAMLDEADARVVAGAFATLIRADSVAAAEWARALLQRGDPVVRTLAANHIARAPVLADLELLAQAYQRAQDDPMPDAAIAAVEALGALSRLGPSQSFAVEDRFVARVSSCDDYLVRQAAAQSLPAAARRWGPAYPVETGRTLEDYREIVRRLVLPSEREGRRPVLVVESELGDFTITLFPEDAPLTVNALLELVDRGYFIGTRFHRVVPDFVIQDGDPRGDGWGGPGFAIRDEVNRRRYGVGTVGMALSGPNTGGSQFFVTVSPQPHLDGTYTVVGTVGEGLEIATRITQGSRIRTIRRR
jgi:cyclophilin family peptidyl-prolyl cis-trans isomerase/HEAT repeat protein